MHTGAAERAERTTSGAGHAGSDRRPPDHWPPTTSAASLRPPPATFPVVPRQAAVTRLVAATTRQVTLVCAPAGAGKTVLAGAWATTAADLAWLGLARDDARRGVFWWHLLEAMSARLSVPDLPERPRGPYDGPGDRGRAATPVGRTGSAAGRSPREAAALLARTAAPPRAARSGLPDPARGCASQI